MLAVSSFSPRVWPGKNQNIAGLEAVCVKCSSAMQSSCMNEDEILTGGLRDAPERPLEYNYPVWKKLGMRTWQYQ